jgi:hypothetical protein
VAADDALPYESAANARLQRIKEALMQEIIERLQRLDQADGKLSSEAAALANAARIRGQVIDLMREAGAPVATSTGEDAVMDAVAAALASSAPVPSEDNGGMLGFSVEPDAKDSIARSVSGVLDQVAGSFGDGAMVMRRAIDVGVNTSSPLQDVIAEVSQALDTTFVQAETAVDTAIRGAMRMATVQQAERGARAAGITMVYLFTGPDDAKKRPFCREHLDKCFTMEAIDGMDNGQGLPVRIYCGGFNCRDLWSPMTLDDAREQGYEVVLE